MVVVMLVVLVVLLVKVMILAEAVVGFGAVIVAVMVIVLVAVLLVVMVLVMNFDEVGFSLSCFDVGNGNSRTSCIDIEEAVDVDFFAFIAVVRVIGLAKSCFS